MLETLSKGVEYLEENTVGEFVDYWVRRHLVIIVVTVAFVKSGQDIWSELSTATRTFVDGRP
jgi:hypothetical protein